MHSAYQVKSLISFQSLKISLLMLRDQTATHNEPAHSNVEISNSSTMNLKFYEFYQIQQTRKTSEISLPSTIEQSKIIQFRWILSYLNCTCDWIQYTSLNLFRHFPFFPWLRCDTNIPQHHCCWHLFCFFPTFQMNAHGTKHNKPQHTALNTSTTHKNVIRSYHFHVIEISNCLSRFHPTHRLPLTPTKSIKIYYFWSGKRLSFRPDKYRIYRSAYFIHYSLSISKTYK